MNRMLSRAVVARDKAYTMDILTGKDEVNIHKLFFYRLA